MHALTKGMSKTLLVNPRWPQRHVLVDNQALICLHRAQTFLPLNIKLVLTRGYQPEGTLLKKCRYGGARLFSFLYKKRRHEICEIFGHNGHAINGTHVDVAIDYNGERLSMLPYGVFTPLWMLTRARRRHQTVLEKVHTALIKAGFVIHKNPTEALQIHCDLHMTDMFH